MKDRKIMNEGIPNPLDQVPPIVDPANNIQRKEAVLRHNFCEHVQKMHQDKNAPFVAEYQVCSYAGTQGLHTGKPTVC